jgi:hypothetical protein
LIEVMTLPALQRGATHWARCESGHREVIVRYRLDCDDDRHIRACVAHRLTVPNDSVRIMATGADERVES